MTQSNLLAPSAAAVSAAFASEEERYDFFAMLNMVVGVLTLVVQVRARRS